MDDENKLCLPKHGFDWDERCCNIEEILLEINYSKEVDGENVTEKKVIAFVRVLLKNGYSALDILFASDSLSDKVNFDSLIIREFLKSFLVKADKETFEYMLEYLNKRQVNAFIDYCLELPTDLQAVHLSALLFYNSTFSRFIELIYNERQLNPSDYPPLPPEAYYEAFFTRKL
jgi:hypothetical protein